MDEIKQLKFAKHKKSSARSVLAKIMFGVICLLVIGIFYLTWTKPIAPAVINYVLGKESLLKVENGRVNVLLLGMAGGKHDGATLTDTIIVASYDTATHQVSLISLPRDLWSQEHRAKINSLYQRSLDNKQGLEFVQTEIGNIVGLTIPYTLRVDFSGFVKAVDLVGGLDIDVERSFEDSLYPIEGKEDDMCGYKEEEQEIDQTKADELKIKPGKVKILLDKDNKIATAAAEPGKDIVYTEDNVGQYFGCRYDRLVFKKGLTHMDGETALKFVRSRHGSGNEGSDFARSRRQQLVLKAFKDKVLSLGTLANPQKVVGLASTFGASFETNIKEDVYIDFIEISNKVDGVKSYVVDPSGPNPLLKTPNPTDYGGAWVLVPTSGDYQQIHQFVQKSLSNQPEATITAQPTKSN